MPQAMSSRDLEAAVDGLEGWRAEGAAIVKELRFQDFSQAFAFLTRLALLAEKQGHHPDFSCSYRTVRIELRSHDAGGVTERDVELAKKLDDLLAAPPRAEQT